MEILDNLIHYLRPRTSTDQQRGMSYDDEWLPVPMEYAYIDAGTGERKTASDQQMTNETFWTCENTLVATDRDGIRRVAYNTFGHKYRLAGAGYESARCFVPFANGNTPADPEMHEKWQTICRIGEQQRAVELLQIQMEYCFQNAVEESIAALDPVHWATIEGLQYAKQGSKPLCLAKQLSSLDDCHLFIGVYAEAGGCLFCLSRNGELLMAMKSEDRVDELHQAGYKLYQGGEDHFLKAAYGLENPATALGVRKHNHSIATRFNSVD